MPETAREELTTAELLLELRRRDVRLSVEGDRLRLSAPPDAVDAALREQLRQHKASLLELLQSEASQGGERPPLRKARPGGKAPLSFAQQRLWFLQQLDPESVAYNLQTCVPLEFPVDKEALRRSLEAVVRRHEILRTRFLLEGDEPVQTVSAAPPVDLPLQDLEGSSVEGAESAAAALRAREARQVFDLRQGPLFRPLLLRFREDAYELVLTQHHIVTDGWSVAVLLEEILAFYGDFSQGRPASLPEPAFQYVDFAVSQREWLQGEVVERQLAYWRRQLAGLPVLELPTDRPRPAVQDTRGAVQPIELPREVAAGLRALARQEGATLFMVLLAALVALLRRLSGQSDVVVGSPSGNRTWVETERMLGLFLNTLVLRTDASGNPSFRELLRRAKKGVLEASAHEELPFERLVEELQPSRDLSRAPFFQVLLVLQNTPLEGLAGKPRAGRRLVAETGTASFDLTFYFMDTEEGLRGYLEYATALFDGATAAGLGRRIETLLREVAADPGRSLLELPLLSAEERRLVLEADNETRAAYPEACVQALVSEQAARTPERIAVVCGEQALAYAELERRSTQLAHRLLRQGAGPGALVGVCMERSIEMVVGLLGILKTGAAYVPLDPAFPASRLAHMLEDARLPLVLSQSAQVDALPRTGATRVFLDRLEALDGEPEDAAGLPEGRLDDRAYVIYTSGSTGRPKGVEVGHRGLTNFLWSMKAEPGLTEDDVLVSVTTLSFDIAGLELYLPLVTGARVVVASREVAQDGARLGALLTASGATVLQATPATWRMLVASGWSGGAGLRLLCGGEALPADLARDLSSRGRALFNLYGPTETTIWSTVGKVEAEEGPVTLGHPLANTRLYLLDDRMEPVPPGVPGELYIGGHGVARGYLNRPELTAERFVPDPFGGEGGERLYRTGDLVKRRGDGRLEFLGRMDDQTKVRGFRVELGEVEAALRSHPLVESAAVVAREDASGEKRLFGYFVAPKESTLSAAELRTFLGERLPPYMVPSGFARLDALPLTPNGKVDRRALPALAPTRPELGALVPPRTPVEAEIVALWRDVLRVPELGIHDNFFELGGHSILATQMVSRLRDALAVELPLRRLFEKPTVAGVAEWLASARGAGLEGPPLVAVPRPEGGLPLSFAQERLFFLERMDPGSPAYNIAGAVRLKGALHRESLERSLREVMRRHEALRSTVSEGPSGPSQTSRAAYPSVLEDRDLSEVAVGRREDEARRVAQEEAQRPFDLFRGPLLRSVLLKLAEDDHALVIVVHHIASDAWSLGVLVREIGALYRAFAAGEPSPLPEPTLQYADYAAWQRGARQGEAFAAQLDYWKRQLGGGLATLALPLDRPRPARRAAAGGHESFLLPPELAEGLKALGRREGATLFMTLLAAFQALLHRVSGQEDVTVGSPISGRNRSELEGLVGLFVNTLVLRTDCSSDPSFRELLGRVREVALSAYANQDVPFEQLVLELRPERRTEISPLFQTMFVLQNAPLPALGLPGLALQPFAFERGTARFDLTLFAWDGPHGVYGVLEYATDVFEAATARRLLSALRLLVEAVVAEPDRRLSRLPLLDAESRQAALVEANATETEYPRTALVHQLFEAQVVRTPEAPALVLGAERVSFAELDRRANRLARRLRATGVGPDVLVGLCLERSFDLVAAILAVLKAGGAYLPLDPDSPDERLRYMVEDAQARVLVSRSGLVARFEGTTPSHVVLLDPAGGDPGTEESGPLEPLGQPANLAYMIYTSGSTGRPKGAMITHQGLVNYLSWAVPAYLGAGGQGSPLHSSIGFDLTVTSLFCPLVAGQPVRLVPETEALADAIEAGCDYGLVKITPAHLEMLRQQVSPAQAAGGARAFVVGGEALLGESLAFWREHAPGVRVVNEYGPTETVVGCCVYEVPPGPVPAGPVPIGSPIANTRLYVLDRNLEPVLPGASGELFIGGDGVARGYWARPDLTAERFVPDPYGPGPGGRLYRTGDLVRRRSEGGLEYLGRTDHQVKVRGYRIELGEIEAELVSHPGVEAATVLAREASGGDRQLTAYVVLGALQPTTTELRRHLKKRLPSYMVPAAYVMLDALPLNENGKVDRRALAALGGRAASDAEGYLPPRTPMEQFVAEVWQEALGLSRVSRHDNFFDLGGHSLLSLRVLARVEERVGRRLGPRELVFATLEQFAAVCEERMKA